MGPLWRVSTWTISGAQFRLRVKMPGRSDNKDKEKRKEVQNELCAKNEYFIYQCTDKEVQKGRVAASRAKSARARPPAPAKAEVKVSAPVSSIKADLAEFRKIKARAPASSARKMSDPEKGGCRAAGVRQDLQIVDAHQYAENQASIGEN